MKKLSYFIVGLLIVSSFAIIGINVGAGEETEGISVSFSNIVVKDSSAEDYIEIEYGGAQGCLYKANTPILPMYTEKFTFPFGTEINSIDCTIGNINTMAVTKKVVPAPTPVFPSIEDSNEVEYIMESSIYNSNELYPNAWFDYFTGGGLDENGNHVTFLTVRAFPVRYSPGLDNLEYIDSIDLTVNYVIPESNPFPSMSTYDLVIITPNKFSSDLQKLVNHKNEMGVNTMLKTLDDIYSEYTGFDKPEQIKYFIKDALETYDMKYVLLVGGMKSLIFGNARDNENEGTIDWHLPVRYTNNRETGSTYDPGFISDLYYADIYDSEGNFSSWDSNGDGIYAKWSSTPGGKDVIDFYPDVAVNRLACRNNFEVKIMVNKIINYETGAYGSDWLDKIILIGGDSFDDAGTNYVEGEVVSEKIMDEYMTEYTPVKLYASYKTSNPNYVPTTKAIKREINKGAGHLFFDGHANPTSWITHYPGEFDGWIPNGGIKIYDFPGMLNFKKLPICAVEGCHNSQFNVTLLASMRDKHNEEHMWTHGSPAPECWSWHMARKIGGGSIATQGNTGLGYGAVGEHGDLDGDGITEPDCTEALGGYYFLMFYESIDEGYDILGDIWAMTETKYCDTFPGMDYQADAKTLEQQAMLGDPSLKIGGYPSGSGFKAEISEAAAGVLGAPGEEVIFEAITSNGQAPFTYAWDFDDDGIYDDATGQVASWTWNLPGVNWVSLKVTDNNGEVDIFDTIVGLEFGATKPQKPSGETKIKEGVTYSYTTSVNSQSGYWNNIYYKFSWGDGTETEWLTTPTASHSWNQKGHYAIKVKALLTHENSKDEDDYEDFKETDWSDPLSISLPRSRQYNRPLLQLFENFFAKFPNAFPLLQYLLGL